VHNWRLNKINKHDQCITGDKLNKINKQDQYISGDKLNKIK